MKGDVVSEVISHPAPASCIQVPMFEATDAIQSARKSGRRNGLQADALALCGRRIAAILESAWAKAIVKVEPNASHNAAAGLQILAC